MAASRKRSSDNSSEFQPGMVVRWSGGGDTGVGLVLCSMTQGLRVQCLGAKGRLYLCHIPWIFHIKDTGYRAAEGLYTLLLLENPEPDRQLLERIDAADYLADILLGRRSSHPDEQEFFFAALDRLVKTGDEKVASRVIVERASSGIDSHRDRTFGPCLAVIKNEEALQELVAALTPLDESRAVMVVERMTILSTVSLRENGLEGGETKRLY